MSNEIRFSPELESLRGAAAIMVVLGHCYILLNIPMLTGSGNFSFVAAKLVHVALDPQPAVLLFFVLSGFVLRLQLQRLPGAGLEKYTAFVIRRAFRLIPPMWASLCFATAALVWQYPFLSSPSIILNGLLLRDLNANLALWSLHVELYCSLLFPVLLCISGRSAIAASMLTGALGLLMVLLPVPMWLMSVQPGAALALHYIVFFQAGLLAGVIGERFPALVGWRYAPIFGVAGLAACQLAPLIAGNNRMLGLGNWTNWMWLSVPACSSAVLFLAHPRTTSVQRVLRSRSARFLGRVSFSVYLIHLPILLVLLPLARTMALDWGRPTLVLLTTAVLVPTIVLSALSYQFIEMPSNRLGRKVAERLKGTRWPGGVVVQVPLNAGASIPGRALRNETRGTCSASML